MDWLATLNLVTVLIVAVATGSLIQGLIRGGSGSARVLSAFLIEATITVVSVLLSWKAAGWLGPRLQAWLVSQHIQVPRVEMNLFEQVYYTMITGIRDFPLLRFGLVFLIGYLIIKPLIFALMHMVIRARPGDRGSSSVRRGRTGFSLLNRSMGAAIGALLGAARSLLIIAVLFIYVTLLPQAPFTGYIQQSGVYQQGASRIIAPFAGDYIAQKLPVLSRKVEQEFRQVLQRRYEVIDSNIPQNIAGAAREITKHASTDLEKAKALYQWVGTRIEYDNDKVRMYEEAGIWKEQTPETTFETRKGVCIDYARLYAVMARAVELKVHLVTGTGYAGNGVYGPHAWNEVYLSEKGQWVPLDATWASSGENWFNPPNFERTHVRDA